MGLLVVRQNLFAILQEAGIPAAALQMLPGDGRIGAALVAAPGVSAVISRPRAVTVRFLNAEGEMEERDFVNLWATSVQHQIDHLNGKLFFDHLGPVKRKMLIAKAEKLKARG